jgi:hypothetical protein
LKSEYNTALIYLVEKSVDITNCDIVSDLPISDTASLVFVESFRRIQPSFLIDRTETAVGNMFDVGNLLRVDPFQVTIAVVCFASLE